MNNLPVVRSPWRIAILVIGFTFLYAPMLMLVIYSFNSSKLVTVWAGWSTRWYSELFHDDAMMSAVGLSLTIAALAATLASDLRTIAAPAMVPPGPDNPMGLYAIYIGRLYAIHGTNANFGIGLRVSQGCIRLRNDDIKFLFDNVPVGTRVQLIDQPVKYSVEPDGSHWLEVHEPLSRNRAEFESDRKVPLPMTSALREFTQGPGVSPSQAEQTLQRRSGMPVNISATAAQGSL